MVASLPLAAAVRDCRSALRRRLAQPSGGARRTGGDREHRVSWTKALAMVEEQDQAVGERTRPKLIRLGQQWREREANRQEMS